MRIAVLGIFRTDVKSLYLEIQDDLTQTEHQVYQKWVRAIAPKFFLLNREIKQLPLHLFDYVFIVDDDIRLTPDFIDDYIETIQTCDFALAQPARTANSSIHHPIVRENPRFIARQTRFVEIGPLFSVRKDLYDVLFPFPESTMGWGLDFIWPVLVEKRGLKMGIVDSCAVEHSLRPNISYDIDTTGREMADLLLRTPHLSREQAYTVLATFPTF